MTNETVVFFENNFGKIYDDKILIVNCNQELKIKDVAFLTVREKGIASKKWIKMAFLGSAIFLILMYFYFNVWIIKLSFFIGFTILLFFAIFYDKKNVFVKIILCYSKPLAFKIKKQTQKEAIEFIQYFKQYRLENPDLRH